MKPAKGGRVHQIDLALIFPSQPAILIATHREVRCYTSVSDDSFPRVEGSLVPQSVVCRAGFRQGRGNNGHPAIVCRRHLQPGQNGSA